jgi:hypothetical protein
MASGWTIKTFDRTRLPIQNPPIRGRCRRLSGQRPKRSARLDLCGHRAGRMR